MYRVVTLIALLAFSTAALAVGRVTTDPNKPGAKAAVASDADTRLEQRVSCDARRQTVSQILADLSEQSGVALYAGYNSVDWQVRDRRMNVFATDIPLKSLMDSIAHVMKFNWSRKELNGQWTYRLYMDRRILTGVERQRLLEEERLHKLEDKLRERVLSDLTKTASMSGAELEAVKTADPLLYNEAKMGWGILMSELFSDVASAKQAWTSGDMLSLNGTDLPPRSQRALAKTLTTMREDVLKTIGPEEAPPQDAANDLSKIRIAINSARQAVGGRGDTCIGDITLYWQDGGMQTAFVDPDSPVGRQIGEDYVRAREAGPMGGKTQGEMNDRHVQAVESQKTDFGEPVVEHPDDPSLNVKVKLQPQGDDFMDLLRSISKASAYAVVSDCLWTYYRGFEPLNTDVSLRSVLDKISTQCRRNWDKRGYVLEFRDRDWFRKRGYQVPEAWLEPWRRSLKTAGTLTLEQLADMALLDDDQIRENLYADDVLYAHGLYFALYIEGDILKGYTRLDDAERAAAFTTWASTCRWFPRRSGMP